MTKGLVRNNSGGDKKEIWPVLYVSSAIDSRADPPNEHYVIWNLCYRVWRNCAVGPSDRRAAAAEVRGLFRGCFGRWPPSKRLEKFGKQRGAAGRPVVPRQGSGQSPPSCRDPPTFPSRGRTVEVSRPRPPSHQLIVKQLSCGAAA